MNGAELPCGSIMQVQPSDPLHKLKRYKTTTESNISEKPNLESSKQEDSIPSPSLEKSMEQQPTVTQSSTTSNSSTPVDDKDDLDDFFSSLE